VLFELIVRAFIKLKSTEPVLHLTERYLNSQLTVVGILRFLLAF